MVDLNMDEALLVVDVCDRIARSIDALGMEAEIAQLSNKLYDDFDEGFRKLGISASDREKLKSYLHGLNVPFWRKKQVLMELYNSVGDICVPRILLEWEEVQ